MPIATLEPPQSHIEVHPDGAVHCVVCDAWCRPISEEDYEQYVKRCEPFVDGHTEQFHLFARKCGQVVQAVRDGMITPEDGISRISESLTKVQALASEVPYPSILDPIVMVHVQAISALQN